MLPIRELTLSLNVQWDSIQAKLFRIHNITYLIKMYVNLEWTIFWQFILILFELESSVTSNITEMLFFSIANFYLSVFHETIAYNNYLLLHLISLLLAQSFLFFFSVACSSLSPCSYLFGFSAGVLRSLCDIQLHDVLVGLSFFWIRLWRNSVRQTSSETFLSLLYPSTMEDGQVCI